MDMVMVAKLNFTKSSLNALKASQKRKYYKDTNNRTPRGFGLYVTPAGAKCFFISRTVEGKTRRLAVGQFPDLSLEKARKKADKLAGQVAEGSNPTKLKRAQRSQGVTLEDAFLEYIDVRGTQLSKNTRSNYSTVINKHLRSWRNKPLKEISRDMVAEKHKALTSESPTAANKAMRLLRAIFNFAHGQYEDEHGRGLFPDNPVSRLSHTRSWNRETRRQNVLKASDMPDWYVAVMSLDETKFERTVRDFLLFILFTGLRRREAAGLKWSDIDLKEKTLIVRDTKNNQPLILPVSKPVEELLARCKGESTNDYVFSSSTGTGALNEPKKRIEKVRKSSGVYFTLHDLRRTFITIAESLDISRYAIKRLVNHRSGGDVTEGYVVMDVERLRTPMDLISEKLVQNLKGAYE